MPVDPPSLEHITATRAHADVLVAEGRFEHAIWMRHRLVRELAQAGDDRPSPDHRRLLAECLCELADAHLASGRPASAHAALGNALGHLRLAADAEGTAADHRRIADLERRVAAIDDSLDDRPLARVTQLPATRRGSTRIGSAVAAIRRVGRRTR